MMRTEQQQSPIWTLAFVAILAVSLLVPLSARSEPKAPQAAEFITTVTESALQVLRDGDASPDRRRRDLEHLLAQHFAMDRIGRFVVGAYWSRMSRDQQVRFQRLFKEWVAGYYSTRMTRYADITVSVSGATALPNGDEIVSTRIAGPSVEQPLAIAWRVKRYDGAPKIIDVIVEGISMVLVQKADFNAVLNKGGVDALLSALDERLIAVSGPAVSAGNGH
jgi:phospholipid transport system substrate-binding protein